MSPQILDATDTRVGPMTRVLVWSDSQVDWKTKRAKDVRCPVCVSRYDDMRWYDTDTTIVLICRCGETFKLDTN